MYGLCNLSRLSRLRMFPYKYRVNICEPSGPGILQTHSRTLPLSNPYMPIEANTSTNIYTVYKHIRNP